MKNQPTDLELFQAERIKALTNELEMVMAENLTLSKQLLRISVDVSAKASLAKIGLERIQKTINDPAFQKPIHSVDYNMY